MTLDALHSWLESACTRERGPVSVRAMMLELDSLRKGPSPETYADLPTDGITMQILLERLEQAGKAKREPGGTLWMWAEPVSKPVVETKPKPTQKDLFA